MGFMGQKKFGDGMKYFCFQMRFRGLETLGVWDCRAVTAHFVHSNAPCNARLRR